MESKTMQDLMAGFAGESQANRKYTAYARKAKAEGKNNAAKLFQAAADAETIHALRHFEVAGKVGSTADNLKDAIAGETYEYTEMYPEFLKDAEAEGNKAAVGTFTLAKRQRKSMQNSIKKFWIIWMKPKKSSTIFARFAAISKKSVRENARFAVRTDLNL